MLDAVLLFDDGDVQLASLALKHLAHLVVERHQVRGAQLKLHFPAFKLAHVKHFADQVKQNARRHPDLLAALALLGNVAVERVAHFHHAADAVDGRADIVAHALQKLGFRRVRALRLARRFGQSFAVFVLLRNQLVQMRVLGLPAQQHHQNNEHRVQRQRKRHA